MSTLAIPTTCRSDKVDKTWQELLSLGGAYLDGKGVPDAAVAMELLMARLLGCGRGAWAEQQRKHQKEGDRFFHPYIPLIMQFCIFF